MFHMFRYNDIFLWSLTSLSADKWRYKFSRTIELDIGVPQRHESGGPEHDNEDKQFESFIYCLPATYSDEFGIRASRPAESCMILSTDGF